MKATDKIIEPSYDPSYDPYQLLRVYTYYRVLLGSLLLLIYKSNLVSNVLGIDSAPLFVYTTWAYTTISLTTLIFLWCNKSAPTLQQRLFAIVSDIVGITLIMFASGGATSGLGYLLIVSVAAAGMLMPAQLAVFIAALATIALIGESIVHHSVSGIDSKALFIAGSLGAMIFITALLFQYLTRKIKASTEELAAHSKHIAHLQKLARLIVERMRTGIVVLNKNDDIELINDAAQRLLSLKKSDDLSLSLTQMPTLKHQLDQWRKGQAQGSEVVKNNTDPGSELRISLANLELGKTEETLAFIEDNRAIVQQAQQLKLASLGRLTASIAHEIRNPLGAISHASQLLSESPNIADADQRLLEIISNHTKRVNQIIENILHVSRRNMATPSMLELGTWARKFIDEYTRSNDSDIALKLNSEPVYATFDSCHLHQILTNLVDNALRYTPTDCAEPVILEIGVESGRQTPYIKIIDKGPGIAPANQKHVFEPFFTTENTGSGLGLFICQELCEANQAILFYQCNDNEPSCFTLQMAHPDKAQQ
ncbi:sensor histidine kinase [Gilvimarinus polysaccharolyticus]|uniref:sensor histidine kinase n=1 Tax=Gilvimarinus polysaccharolyticus TaxID=863921 RepID=UPI00067369C5|nr:ATP-binding protein [Gilvimarinus polysaccharolyticus]